VNKDLIVGLITTFVPLFAGGYLMLRKQESIFRFFIAMLLIGMGYLTATGAINDIGRTVLGKMNYDHAAPTVPAAAPAAAPAAPAPAK
jgi:hypothetical protein